MPIKKSAQRALRNATYKTKRNSQTRTVLEITLKGATTKNLAGVISKIDKAVKVGILPAKRATRVKSRLVKKLGNPAKLSPRASAGQSVPTKRNSKRIKTASVKPKPRRPR